MQSFHIETSKVLGKGGFSYVFEGSYHKEIVAIKRVLLENVESTKHEEEAMKKLDHPNVIKLLHTQDDSHFR